MSWQAFAMKQHVSMLPSLTHKEIGTSTQTNKRIELNKIYSLNEREKAEYVDKVIHVLFPLLQITMYTLHDAITTLTLRKKPKTVKAIE